MKKFNKIGNRIQLHLLEEEELLVNQGNEERLEFFRTKKARASELLEGFVRNKVLDDGSLRAVVGIDDFGMPVFWDITKGNLLIYGKAILGAAALGGFLPLLSLLRFSKKELIYYCITRERMSEIFMADECCKGWGIVTEGNCGEVLEALLRELEQRQTMPAEEVEKLPYILIVFAGGDDIISAYWPWYQKLFSAIFTQGKTLRIACVLGTGSLSKNPCFYWYGDSFSACLLEKDCDLGERYALSEEGHRYLRQQEKSFMNNNNRVLYCDDKTETVVGTEYLLALL